MGFYFGKSELPDRRARRCIGGNRTDKGAWSAALEVILNDVRKQCPVDASPAIVRMRFECGKAHAARQRHRQVGARFVNGIGSVDGTCRKTPSGHFVSDLQDMTAFVPAPCGNERRQAFRHSLHQMRQRLERPVFLDGENWLELVTGHLKRHDFLVGRYQRAQSGPRMGRKAPKTAPLQTEYDPLESRQSIRSLVRANLCFVRDQVVNFR